METEWIVLRCPSCEVLGEDERWPMTRAEEQDKRSKAHLCPRCGTAGIPDTHWKRVSSPA